MFYNGSEEEAREVYKAFFDLSKPVIPWYYRPLPSPR